MKSPKEVAAEVLDDWTVGIVVPAQKDALIDWMTRSIKADRTQRPPKPSDSVSLGIHHKAAAEAVAAFTEAAGPESKATAAFVAAGILSALVFIHEMEEKNVRSWSA